MDNAEFDRRMAQMFKLFEMAITKQATQPVVVNVNLDTKKKKAAVIDNENDGVEAVEPGGQPRPYTS